MRLPISSTEDYYEYLALKGLECPKCGETKNNANDIQWLHEFMECLSCDHSHNEEIEEAVR